MSLAIARNQKHHHARLTKRPLRFRTFLAPNLFPVYDAIVKHVGKLLGWRTELCAGEDYDEVADSDVILLCGLAYVLLDESWSQQFVPLAAPIFTGDRYEGKTVYY